MFCSIWVIWKNDVSKITKTNRLSITILIAYPECSKLFIFQKVQVICNVNVILCVIWFTAWETHLFFVPYSNPHISLPGQPNYFKVGRHIFHIILVHDCKKILEKSDNLCTQIQAFEFVLHFNYIYLWIQCCSCWIEKHELLLSIQTVSYTTLFSSWDKAFCMYEIFLFWSHVLTSWVSTHSLRTTGLSPTARIENEFNYCTQATEWLKNTLPVFKQQSLCKVMHTVNG